jgi:hypothetical protein
MTVADAAQGLLLGLAYGGTLGRSVEYISHRETGCFPYPARLCA